MDLVSALPVPLAGPRTPTRVVGCVGRPTGTPNKQYGGLGGLGFVNDGGHVYRGVRGGRKSNKIYPDECRLKLEHPLEALVSMLAERTLRFNPTRFVLHRAHLHACVHVFLSWG